MAPAKGIRANSTPTTAHANYHGQAEKWWGFVRSDNSHKPAWQTVHDGIRAEVLNPAPPGKPNAPTNLAASGAASSIGLSWTAPADNGAAITNYNVYRATVSNAEVLYVTLGNVQSYTDVSVAAGTTYYYKVTAINSPGESPLSNEASATTISNPTPPPPTPNTYEAESFPTKTTGGIYTDASFSGGKGWNIWANGSIDQPVTLGSATDEVITIWAKGDLAGSQPPHMVLLGNGVTLQEWDVPTTALQQYSVRTTLASGTTTLRITFTNDYLGPLGDRNLIVDKLDLSTPSPRLWGQEAEVFTSWTAGQRQTDAAASGGAMWNLWANGSGTTTFTTSLGGPQELRVYAKSNYVTPSWAIMRAYVDNVQVAQWTVDTASYGAYVVLTSITAGSHQLKVEFTNDYLGPLGDRNLLVDKAEIWSTPMTASFTQASGNNWWQQIHVVASKTLAGVDTRVNGGAWQTLTYQTWGDWAASHNAPTGSLVDFRATATDGTVVISSTYNWSPP